MRRSASGFIYISNAESGLCSEHFLPVPASERSGSGTSVRSPTNRHKTFCGPMTRRRPAGLRLPASLRWRSPRLADLAAAAARGTAVCSPNSNHGLRYLRSRPLWCRRTGQSSREDGMIKVAGKAWTRITLLALVSVAAVFWGGAVSAQEPIKIGFSVSLTGGLASSGKAHLLSKQIWVEEINAKGGLLGRPVKLVYYDDQTNASTVPGIYAKLIDVDKVDLLMGAATNLIVAAMPMIMERKRMVMVLLALGSNAEFKYPKYFQSAPFGPDPKGVLSEAFFQVAKTISPAPKTVALVGADAEFSNNVLVGARRNAEKF